MRCVDTRIVHENASEVVSNRAHSIRFIQATIYSKLVEDKSKILRASVLPKLKSWCTELEQVTMMLCDYAQCVAVSVVDNGRKKFTH